MLLRSSCGDRPTASCPHPLVRDWTGWLARWMRAGLAASLGLAAVALPPAAALAQSRRPLPQQPALPQQPTLLQQLRELLGITRRVSAGGSRAGLPMPTGGVTAWVPVSTASPPRKASSSRPSAVWGEPSGSSSDPSAASLCLLSPWLPQNGESAPAATTGAASPDGWPPVVLALTPSGAPPIVSREPLAEVQILRGSTLLWRARGSSSAPLTTPLAWPLPPLQPGESVRLKLRLQGADGGSFSQVELRRPPQRAAAPPAPAAADGTTSLQTLQTLLQSGRSAEAVEWLFQGDLAGISPLRQLAQDAITAGCTAASPAATPAPASMPRPAPRSVTP